MLPRVLNSIWYFTQQYDNPLTELICNDVMSTEERLDLNSIPLRTGISMEDVWDHLRINFPRLNSSQIEAVTSSFLNRILIVQGPPGTGKTTTASTKVHVQRVFGKRPVVCTSSNVALDTFAVALRNLNEPFARYGSDVTSQFREDILEYCPEVQKIEELKAAGWDPKTEGKKNHTRIR